MGPDAFILGILMLSFKLFLEKTPTLGKIEDRIRRGWQRIRWLEDIIDSMDMSLSKLQDTEGQGSLAFCSPWGYKESDST